MAEKKNKEQGMDPEYIQALLSRVKESVENYDKEVGAQAQKQDFSDTASREIEARLRSVQASSSSPQDDFAAQETVAEVEASETADALAVTAEVEAIEAMEDTELTGSAEEEAEPIENTEEIKAFEEAEKPEEDKLPEEAEKYMELQLQESWDLPEEPEQLSLIDLSERAAEAYVPYAVELPAEETAEELAEETAELSCGVRSTEPTEEASEQLPFSIRRPKKRYRIRRIASRAVLAEETAEIEEGLPLISPESPSSEPTTVFSVAGQASESPTRPFAVTDFEDLPKQKTGQSRDFFEFAEEEQEEASVSSERNAVPADEFVRHLDEFHIEDKGDPKEKDPIYECKNRTGTEFVSRNQIDRIQNEYHRRLLWQKIKCISIAVLAALLFVSENLLLFFLPVPTWISFKETAIFYPLVDLILFVGIALFSVQDLSRAFCAWRKKETVTESFSFLVILFTLLYHALLLIFPIQAYPAVSFASAVFVLLGAVSQYLELHGEICTFRTLARPGDKLAAELTEDANLFGDLAQESRPYRVMRIKKVGFVDGYFRRTEAKEEDTGGNNLLLFLSFVFSLLVGGVYALLAEEFSVVLFFACFLLAFLMSATSSALLWRRLPFWFLRKKASAAGSAVIGEGAIREYPNADVIAFEDVEAFPSAKTKIQGIKIFGDTRPDEIFSMMAELFSLLGGPLIKELKDWITSSGNADIRLLETAEDGLCAEINGRKLRVGKGTYMEDHDIPLPYDSDDEAYMEKGNVSVLYVCEGKKLQAKFYIAYRISTRFLNNARLLQKNNISTVLRSYDPCIDFHMIRKFLQGTEDVPEIYVSKKGVGQIYDFAQLRVDSGLVTETGSKDLLKWFFACIRTRKAMSIGRKVRFAMSVFGMLLTLCALYLGILLAFPSVIPAMVIVLSALPILFLCTRI